MSHRGPRSLPIAAIGLLGVLLAACSSTPPEPSPSASARLNGIYKLGTPYQIDGRWYHPFFDPAYDEVGIASWYGDEFHGLPTANGEVFDKARLSAAHPTMPLPSIVRITNLANGRTQDLRVNDRGPFIGDRLIDVSQAAASALGFEHAGTTPVRVQFLRLADAAGTPPRPSPRSAGPAPPAPDLQPASAAPPGACDADGRFIQVGAFAEPARAHRVARQLEATLRAPVLTQPPVEDHLVRVRLGPLARRDEVALALQQLEQIGYDGAFLVRSAGEPGPSC